MFFDNESFVNLYIEIFLYVKKLCVVYVLVFGKLMFSIKGDMYIILV